MRCTAIVYERDEYRYTGGGSSGFTMHYSQTQCSREALIGRDKCWQHDDDAAQARRLRAHERRLQRRRTRRDDATAS